MKNKRALVCGSSKGIGAAAAIELSKCGASITLVARNELVIYLTISAVVEPVLTIGVSGNATENICLTFVVAGLGPPIIILS